MNIVERLEKRILFELRHLECKDFRYVASEETEKNEYNKVELKDRVQFLKSTLGILAELIQKDMSKKL